MSQTVLLGKLANYLKLVNRKVTSDLQKDLRKGGYCYGLSVCYATMKLTGKLAWWEAALVKVANWDGSLKTLKQKASLPNAKDPDETLEHVMERVLNYVVFNHVYEDANSYQSIKISDVTQPTFLLPKTAYYEMLDENSDIQVIKARECMAGYFEAKQLIELLDEKIISDTICLIHNTEHTICLSYKKPDWFLYDPNYPHDIKAGKAIHKKFKSKEALVDEIFEVQGQSLAIECASFKHTTKITFPKYEQLLKNSSYLLAQEYGLHIIATEIPQRIPELIARVKKHKQGSYLIACALTEPDAVRWTGLHKLAYYAPKHLSLVLEYAAESDGGHDFIAEAIKAIEPDNDWSCLYTILLKSPEFVPQLLDYLTYSAIGPDCLVSALVAKTKLGVSGWDMLTKVTPQYRKSVEDMIINSADNIESSHLSKLIEQIKQTEKNIKQYPLKVVFFNKGEDKFKPLQFIKQLESIVREKDEAVSTLAR